MITFIRRWFIEILIVAAVLFFAFQLFRSYRENGLLEARAVAAEKAHHEALQQAALGQEAIHRADGLQKERDILDGERKTLLAAVGKLKRDLDARPTPPRPGPVPSEQAQLVADLRSMGTSPEIAPALKLAFPAQDGPILWTWGKQSARVPALEGRIFALENFSSGVQATLDKTTMQLQVAERQSQELTLSTGHFKGAFEQEAKRGELLTLQVGTITKQRDRARSTRIYIGVGALAVGAYLGSRL